MAIRKHGLTAWEKAMIAVRKIIAEASAGYATLSMRRKKKTGKS